MNIDTILQVLNYLDFNYSVNHTNDYSEVVIPANNEGADLSIMFDCASREIYNKHYVEEETYKVY